jgi:hypothetical protein
MGESNKSITKKKNYNKNFLLMLQVFRERIPGKKIDQTIGKNRLEP